jgi:RNase adaptor protein for sRNA GlmZ degradation
MTTDKDNIIKKLRLEVEKIKKEKDELKRLKEIADLRLKSLEQSILDLNSLVERCQRDIDINTAKRDKFIVENQSLQ